ncbi:MAG: hypothetical protein ACO2Z9_10020, partial [Crocinitomicaceae bacterium]
MKNNMKPLGFGILGGMIPVAIFMLFNVGSTDQSNESYHIDKNNAIAATPVGLNASSLIPSENFVAASENSLNSVVHVTTQVVTTSF